jgi:hypothetical protein
MTIIVNIERYFPPDFFKGSDDISVSEKLGRAIIVSILDIDENSIKRGDPVNFEPDFITDTGSGFEITFASNRNADSGSSIARLKKGNYHYSHSEEDLIASISDSVQDKADKKNNGNYKNISSVSPIIISIDTNLFWYDQEFTEKWPHTLIKKDAFFSELYKKYIETGIFENIFILLLTAEQTYVLFDIDGYYKNTDNCSITIGLRSLENLPHSKVVGITDNKKSGPLITYQYHDIHAKVSNIRGKK